MNRYQQIFHSTSVSRNFWIAEILLSVLFIACSGRHSTSDARVFRYNESNGISSLDPAFSRDLESMWATNQLFDGLVELDSSLHIIPCMARSWKISPDGRTYTFILRDSIWFHPSPVFTDTSGRKATASDFVYSFQRLLDPKVASPGQWIFSRVDISRQGGFEALNDTTLVIYLKEAFQPFLSVLTTQYASVVPHEAVEKYGADFREHPVGTGPFQFAFWDENVALVFHRFGHYWQTDQAGRSLPYLDAVQIDFVKDMSAEFYGLIKGQYDFMSGIQASYKDELLDLQGNLVQAYSDQVRFVRVPFIKTDYLGILIDPGMEVSSSSPLMDSRVRKALYLAINKKEMALHLRNNTVFPADGGFIPPALLSRSGKAGVAYSPAQAAALLAEAGYPGGKGIPPIKIAVTSDYTDLIEYIQNQWERIGVHSTIQVMQKGAFSDAAAKGQLQVFRKSWLADYPDAENFLAVFYSGNFSPSGPNYTHFSDQRFDDLYADACRQSSDSLRYRDYERMDSLVTLEMPVIPLFYDQVSHFIRKNVHGLQTNSVNMIDLRRVWKDQ